MMIVKKLILKIIVIFLFVCALLLSGCLDFIKYPRYKLERQNSGQYIMTSPDGIEYTTIENNLWYPDFTVDGQDFDSAIGKSDIGYIFNTTSDVCLFSTARHARHQYYFFLSDIVLPKLSIENINNMFIKETYYSDININVDLVIAEEFIELYNNTEIHEIKNIQQMDRICELYMECEQYRGLYFGSTIYKDGTDYYMFISFQENGDGAVCSKCTKEVKTILKISKK